MVINKTDQSVKTGSDLPAILFGIATILEQIGLGGVGYLLFRYGRLKIFSQKP